MPSMSILNPGIRIFLENLRKPRRNGSGFGKERWVEKNGGSNPRQLGLEMGCGSKLNSWGYAGFGVLFPYTRCQFGVPFVESTQLRRNICLWECRRHQAILIASFPNLNALAARAFCQATSGHGSKPKSVSPGEHPNPTTKIGSKMSGEFTYPEMGSHWC